MKRVFADMNPGLHGSNNEVSNQTEGLPVSGSNLNFGDAPNGSSIDCAEMDLGHDTGKLGLTDELYNVIKDRSKEIVLPCDIGLGDTSKTQGIVNDAIDEMKRIIVEHDERSGTAPMLQDMEAGVADPSDDMTLIEFAEFLGGIPDWSKISVVVLLKGFGCFSSDQFKNKLEFLGKLQETEETQIFSITIAKLNTSNFWTNCPPIKRSSVSNFLSPLYPKLFRPSVTKEELLGELDKLYTQSTEQFESKRYFSELVESEPDVGVVANFCSVPTKSKVVVIGGESGSGKTVFATHTIPDKIRSISGYESSRVLYHCLEDGNSVRNKAEGATPTSIKVFLGLILKTMVAIKESDTELFRRLSGVNMELNQDRNKNAINRFTEIWETKFSDLHAANEWWSEKPSPLHLTLDGLVIIIDEIGKDMMFGHGLVEMGRNIVNYMCTQRRTRKCLLILVGAGCDAFGREDPALATFGTDPTKAAVVVIRNTNIEPLEGKLSILKKEIRGGAYSRVLASNARMLMRGIVPVLTSPLLSDDYRPGNQKLQTQFRIEAASFRAIMHYCYRVYISLNGLGRLDEEEIAQTMRDLFQFLLKKELNTLSEKRDIGWNMAVQELIQELPTPKHEDDFLFKLGVATQTFPASSAMKFLACEGLALPVYSGNGIEFEEVVRLHLTRLFQLSHDEITVEFNLKFAWPPNASPNAYKLCNSGEFCGEAVTSKEHNAEIKRLIDVIEKAKKEEKNVHVVMHQLVPNAQGPDIMILHIIQGTGFLDLFQVKNRTKLPSKTDIEDWTSSLGLEVKYNSEGICEVVSTSTRQECIYTSKCLETMLATLEKELLERKIANSVRIRRRYLVIKQSWDNKMQHLWSLDKVENVRVWTSDFLEPTVSALLNTNGQNEVD